MVDDRSYDYLSSLQCPKISHTIRVLLRVIWHLGQGMSQSRTDLQLSFFPNKNRKSRQGAKGARKVKTGCQTCKIRHKKCDEVRPACSQCRTTDRKCDFLTTEQLTSILAKDTSNNKRPYQALGIHNHDIQIQPFSQPFRCFPLHQLDTSHFTYFEYICAKEFSVHFETSLLTRTILQAANSEICICHAILAVNSLHQNIQSSHQHPTRDNKYAVKEYNQAILELNNRINNSAESWTLAVLSSLLFITFELLQQNTKLVRMHMRNAFKILKNPPTRTTPLNIELLANAFSRLDIQASPFDLPHTNTTTNPNAPSILVLPPIFTTLDSARESLNSISNILNSQTNHPHTLNTSNSFEQLFPRNQTQNIHSLLETWSQLFSTYETHNPPPNPATHSSILILKIQYLITYIRLSISIPITTIQTLPFPSLPLNLPEETIYDTYHPQFTQIIHYAFEILHLHLSQNPATSPPTPHTPSTTPTPSTNSNLSVGPSSTCTILDITLIQPLLFTILKCRDSQIRRQGIYLLEQVRGWKVFDLGGVIEGVTWVVGVEEGMSGRNGDVIREEDMLRGVEIEGLEDGRWGFGAWMWGMGDGEMGWRRVERVFEGG